MARSSACCAFESFPPAASHSFRCFSRKAASPFFVREAFSAAPARFARSPLARFPRPMP